MDNKKLKNILKLALTLYLASFLVLNWADVSWIFNYRQVSGMIGDFFNPYPSIDASEMDLYFYPNRSRNLAEKTKIEANTRYTDKQNVLEIPSLSLETSIIFSASADTEKVTKDLDLGVVYYPGSVYPGEEGQIVILGHSAPPGWPKIKHDWVFSNIDKLKQGDIVLIHLNNKEYSYKVTNTNIIKKGNDVPSANLDGKSALVLISCWPPGKDYQRIAVSAILE